MCQCGAVELIGTHGRTIEWAHPWPPPTPNWGFANWRPQIEHNMWGGRMAWSPLWWWPCTVTKIALIVNCHHIDALHYILSSLLISATDQWKYSYHTPDTFLKHHTICVYNEHALHRWYPFWGKPRAASAQQVVSSDVRRKISPKGSIDITIFWRNAIAFRTIGIG